MVYLNPFDLGSGLDFFPHAICITCFYRTIFSSFHSFAALFVYCAHLSIPCHLVVSLFALFPIGICIMVVQLSQCIAICAFQYRFGYKIREGNLWPMAIFKFFFHVTQYHNDDSIIGTAFDTTEENVKYHFVHRTIAKCQMFICNNKVHFGYLL